MTLAATRGRKKRQSIQEISALQNAAAELGAEQCKHAAGPPVPDAAALLAWYDRHRRVLPWRALPGVAPDPYRVWLSEIMLQQTTVKSVAPYFQRFISRWPSLTALAAAPLDDILKAWAGLGYYTRARNLHACARQIVSERGGRFPETEADLRGLPGVGAYTAAAIAAIAFGRRAAPVDGNIERVIARLFGVAEPLPGAKPRIRALAQSLAPALRAGDFAQAMMDLGATVCTPRRPACLACPWSSVCAASRSGEAEAFPHRAPKMPGPLRRGAAFWVLRADGRVLIRTRPAPGLLGGMAEVPTSLWSSDFDEGRAVDAAPMLAPAAPGWRRVPGAVAHTFTHFPLELIIYAARAPHETPPPPEMRWVPLPELAQEALPTLMRKVVAYAMANASDGR